jgi:hypothetical protein
LTGDSNSQFHLPWRAGKGLFIALICGSSAYRIRPAARYGTRDQILEQAERAVLALAARIGAMPGPAIMICAFAVRRSGWYSFPVSWRA